MQIDTPDLMSHRCQVADMVAVDGIQQLTEYRYWLRYSDDANGKELRADVVKEARREEIRRSAPHEGMNKGPKVPVLV